MSDDNTTIHEFDLSLIGEYFSAIKRQGPGSPDVTIRALSFVENLTSKSRIADIGCGTGGQTMILAEHTPAQITGIDLFPVFIDLFNGNASKLAIQDRVKGIVGSMDNLPFADSELDLIWSEGAIYNIGFEKGLQEWRRFLKPGGYIAVTEASWFTEERPEEIDIFWKNAYPGIDTIPNKMAQLQKSGYMPVAMFVLTESCWTEHFYNPQIKAQEIFLQKHAGNKAAGDMVAYMRNEAEIYMQYKAFYGYVFYIGKKL